jgi:hypothetical protein
MDFNPTSKRYPEALVESSYYRETRMLLQVQKYKWAPENVEAHPAERKVYFKWYHNTCQDFMPHEWKQQLEQIASDLHHERLYKPNFYQKSFYTDDRGQLHAYIFYSTSTYKEQPINMDFYRPILNEDRQQLVDVLAVDGGLDMGTLVKHAFTSYIKWPEDPLPEIYQRVYQ